MPGEIFDGFIELREGMNGYRNASLLTQTQYANGINVSARGGLVKTRPSIVAESVVLPEGFFQGAGVWSLESGDRLVYVADGIVYTINASTLALTTIGLKLDPTAQCFLEQVDRYMVLQDGTDTVVLHEVAGVDEEYTGANSIPAGYSMVFAQGRLHMVPKLVPSTTVVGRPYIVSGDIMLPLEPETALQFTETDYLSEGGAHGLPAEMGYINGLGSIRNASTGTGVGQVIAFGRRGVCAFDFSLIRDFWKEQALSQVLFFSAGCESPWSILNANNDLIYRSQDGLRVLKYTASQISGGSGSLSNTPMSIEVDEYLKGDAEYLSRVSTTLANNRVLAAASGIDSIYFQALISWDVAAGFYSGAQGVGAYDGVWTGLNFAQALTAFRSNEQTGYIFAEGPVLYRIDEDAVYDGVDTPIEARVDTRIFPFGDMVTRKKLKYAELWVSDMPVTTEFSVYYRPQGYPLWTLMSSRTVTIPLGSLPQSRRRLKFSVQTDSEGCDPTTKEFLSTGTGFQFAIKFTGRATIERLRASAEPLTEQPPTLCDNSEEIMLTSDANSGILLNNFGYTI